MLWICQACTTPYSVGAPACPACGSTGHVDEGSAEHAALTEAKATDDDATLSRNQLIRAWAAENGYEVAASGKIPLEVQAAYDDAHDDPDGEEG